MPIPDRQPVLISIPIRTVRCDCERFAFSPPAESHPLLRPAPVSPAAPGPGGATEWGPKSGANDSEVRLIEDEQETDEGELF